MEESDFDEENENPDNVEEELDPENPEHAFAILERDYTKVETMLIFIRYLFDQWRNYAVTSLRSEIKLYPLN